MADITVTTTSGAIRIVTDTLGAAASAQASATSAAAAAASAAAAAAAAVLAISTLPDGTVTAPAIAFASDSNTGIYRIGADNLGVAAAGAKVLDIGTGGLGVTGALSATGTITGTGLIDGETVRGSGRAVIGDMGISAAVFYHSGVATINDGYVAIASNGGVSISAKTGQAVDIRNNNSSIGSFSSAGLALTGALSASGIISSGTAIGSGGAVQARAAAGSLLFGGWDTSANAVGYAVMASGTTPGQVNHYATWGASGIDCYHAFYVTNAAGVQTKIADIASTGIVVTGAATISGHVLIGSTSDRAALYSASSDGGAYSFGASGTTSGVRIVHDAAGSLIQGVDHTLAATYKQLTVGGSSVDIQGYTGNITISPSGATIGTWASAGLTISNAANTPLTLITSDAINRISMTNASRTWSLGPRNDSPAGGGGFSIADESGGAYRLSIDTSGTTRINGSLEVSSTNGIITAAGNTGWSGLSITKTGASLVVGIDDGVTFGYTDGDGVIRYTAGKSLNIIPVGGASSASFSASGLAVAGLTKTTTYFSVNDVGYIRGDDPGWLRFQSGTSGFSFRDNGNANEWAQLTSTGLAVTGVVSTSGYTVATLPAGTVGQRAYVTDATAPTFLGTLTGGGAVTCPVVYNGSAWVSA